METVFHNTKTFEKIDQSGVETKQREFEQCIFLNCNFSGGSFSSCRFIDCTFTNCDMANMKLRSSQLSGVTFQGCKLLGVNFSECTDILFNAAFNECVLDYASFSYKKMSKTPFNRCSMKHTDLSGADLSLSKFLECDLTSAVFNKTILKEADFLSAYNYVIDPELNNMKKAKFSPYGIIGLLQKYDIVIE